MVVMTVTPTPRKQRWAPLTEAAKYMGISRYTLRRDIQAGKIRKYWYGGLVIVDLDEIDELIQSSLKEDWAVPEPVAIGDVLAELMPTIHPDIPACPCPYCDMDAPATEWGNDQGEGGAS